MYIEFEGAFLNVKEVISATVFSDDTENKVLVKTIFFGLWPIYETVKVQRYKLVFDFIENSPTERRQSFIYRSENRPQLMQKLKEIVTAVKDSSINHLNQIFEETVLK